MTKKTLIEYTEESGKTSPLRVFITDKGRIEELQRTLTMATGGVPFTHAQVISYLLDLAEAMDKFVRQEPLEEQ